MKAAENGCRVAAGLDDLAAADIVVTMLPTGQIVRDLYLVERLAHKLRRGTIAIDMSSSNPSGTTGRSFHTDLVLLEHVRRRFDAARDSLGYTRDHTEAIKSLGRGGMKAWREAGHALSTGQGVDAA